MAEIASAFVTIAPSMKGFRKDVTSEVGASGDAASNTFGKRFGARMKDQGSSLGRNFGRAFAVGATVAGAAGAVFLKDSIVAASDLGETMSKVNQIFGKEGARSLETWSKTSASAMGQSQQQALDAASTFAIFGKSAGLSGQELTSFSTGFTTLASDLASFHNASPEETIEAIGSALRGEAEPMRRFGVLLDDASLRQEALRQGIIKTTKQALTPQQKVLAAQALIYKQTQDAQGDFAKTSGGLANQQRILAARFADVRVKIGSVLLPVALRFVTFLNNGLAPALARAHDAVKPVGDYLAKTFAPVIQRVTDFMQRNPAVVKAFAIALGVLAVAIGIVTLATAAFSLALQTTGIPLLIIGIAALVAGLVYAYQRSEQFRAVVQSVGAILRSLADWIRSDVIPVVQQLATKVAKNLQPVFTALSQFFSSSVLPVVQKLLAKFREWQPTIQRVATFVVRLTAKWVDFYTTLLGKVLPPLIRFAGFLVRSVGPAVAVAIAIVGKMIGRMTAFGSAMNTGAQRVTRFAAAVGRKVSEVVAFFARLPAAILGILTSLGGRLYGAGVALIGRLKDGVQDKINDVVDTVRAGVSKIAGLLPGSPIKWGPLKSWNNGGAGKRLMEMLATGIRRGGKDVQNAAREVLERVNKTAAKEAGKLQELLSARRAKAGEIAGNLRNEFDLSAIAAPNEFGFSPSAGTAVKAAQAIVARMKGFANRLALLVKGGMPNALVQEIAGMGSTDGSRVADVFLSANAKERRELTTAYAGVNRYASQVGNIVAGQQYNGAIERQRDRAEEAGEVARHVRRELTKAPFFLAINGRTAGRVYLEGQQAAKDRR